MRPASKTPYPIYDQNLRFDAVLMTVAAATAAPDRAFVYGRIDNDNVTSSKPHTQLKARVQIPYPIEDQN